jgi:hypothetical protein
METSGQSHMRCYRIGSSLTGIRVSIRNARSRTIAVLAGFLAIAGLVVWCDSHRSFTIRWFHLQTAHSGTTKAVAVFPRAGRACPVVFYFYGAGGSLISAGSVLRQLADLGFAALAFEYDTGNAGVFSEQLLAAYKLVSSQPWADPRSIAWIGYSRGTERIDEMLVDGRSIGPSVYVRIAGVPMYSAGPLKTPHLNTKILVAHGDADEVFPIDGVIASVKRLRDSGVPLELKVLRGEDHTFGRNQQLIYRLAGEYCKSNLTPARPLPDFPISGGFSVFACLSPSLLLLGLKLLSCTRSQWKPLKKWFKVTDGKYVNLFASAAVAASVAHTSLYAILPRLPVTPLTLNLARRLLVPERCTRDFDYLVTKVDWKDHRIMSILGNTELSDYCSRLLVRWRPRDEMLYQEYVLSPLISGPAAIDSSCGIANANIYSNSECLEWRAELWSYFYPDIRNEAEPLVAAATLTRKLRARVTIVPGNFPMSVREVWRWRIASAAGFNTIYVAVLRSCGIASRIGATGSVELWSRDKWHHAPEPMVSMWNE